MIRRVVQPAPLSVYLETWRLLPEDAGRTGPLETVDYGVWFGRWWWPLRIVRQSA